MWHGWPIERMLFAFSAVVFAAIFVQVTLFHLRQNFRHPAMWLPVIATPLIALLAAALAWQPVPWLRAAFAVCTGAGAVAGLVGTYYHVAGVGERVDGYTLNNFMVGPPPALPLMITAMSILGLIALYAV
ncbi:MAG TPA: hypothetical protein VF234_01040 [Limnochordia bacterium]